MPHVEDVEVLENQPVGDDYWHLLLRATPSHTSAKPGQFFHLQCPVGSLGPSYLRRPMSVYGTNPAQQTVEFLYKVTGVGTDGLSTLKPGDSLNMFGPLGQGFSLRSQGGRSLIVARGVGLATMGPLVGALVKNGNRVDALCSFRNPESVVGLSPFHEAGVTVTTVFDSDGSSSVDNVASYINERASLDSFASVYTCGSRRLARMLGSLRCLRTSSIEVALEQRMACGLGMCHACVIDVWSEQGENSANESASSGEVGDGEAASIEGCDGVDRVIESRRVCCDGPVFALSSVVSITPGPASRPATDLAPDPGSRSIEVKHG